MDKTTAPIVLGANEGEALWCFGSLMTIKTSGAENGSSFSIVEDFASRDDGTPLHVHRDDDESFYVLDGELTFFLGDDQPIRASVGAFVHIPGGTVHAFQVSSETARYLIVTSPQHLRFYRAISEPAGSRSLPPDAPLDMEKIEAACQEYGVELLGPPPGAAS